LQFENSQNNRKNHKNGFSEDTQQWRSKIAINNENIASLRFEKVNF